MVRRSCIPMNMATDKRTKATPGVTTPQPASQGFEPYISKLEVARRMGRTARCVELMMSRGILPFYRWDSQAAFRWSEVQLALAGHYRVGGPAAGDGRWQLGVGKEKSKT